MPKTVSRLGWIKRRARCIQKFYGVTRRLAVFDARHDFFLFHKGLYAVK